MRILLVVAAICLGFVSNSFADLWINELHYDNIGGDTGEFVEVVVAPNMASVDLSTVTLTLYNGSNGTSYDTDTLDTFAVGANVNGFQVYSLSYGANGIQNGNPDGLALDVGGVLVQFLSYEGAFTATDGVANGVLSTNIGVAESNNTTAVGHSLQLVGTGATYDDFTWAAPQSNTLGAVNTGQTAVPEPSAFLFGGLVCSVLGVNNWRKRRVAER